MLLLCLPCLPFCYKKKKLAQVSAYNILTTANTTIAARITTISITKPDADIVWLLFSWQANAQLVEADGVLELYPSRLLQSVTVESKIINPNPRKIETAITIPINPINEFSTMVNA